MATKVRKPKRLVPSDILENRVEFWTKKIGAHVVECDSVNKETFHKKWPTEDDTKIDYKANLQKGLYNYGLSVRTGLLHRGPYLDWYLGCIDFDSFEAFQTWCGEDYTLDNIVIWTRVEWHRNIYFLSA
jgi:hypothetical protein